MPLTFRAVFGTMAHHDRKRSTRSATQGRCPEYFIYTRMIHASGLKPGATRTGHTAGFEFFIPRNRRTILLDSLCFETPLSFYPYLQKIQRESWCNSTGPHFRLIQAQNRARQQCSTPLPVNKTAQSSAPRRAKRLSEIKRGETCRSHSNCFPLNFQ